ncbi:ABC-type sugar transport system ATPase subunit [Streptomyces sp. V4I23]|nr:ABC-type sugar transport system ATPase subunit [Streptomyces sp. V4I23]
MRGGLATHMAEKGSVYILQEPAVGLHLADVEQLPGLLDQLVDSGKSVIVVEHHPAVMAHADWITDLGPGRGPRRRADRLRGTSADLVAARSTLTGEHLADYVGEEPPGACAPGAAGTIRPSRGAHTMGGTRARPERRPHAKSVSPWAVGVAAGVAVAGAVAVATAAFAVSGQVGDERGVVKDDGTVVERGATEEESRKQQDYWTEERVREAVRESKPMGPLGVEDD